MAEEAKKEAEGAEEGGKKKLPLWVMILIASQVVIVVVAIIVFKMMSSSHAEKPVEPTEAEQKVEPEKMKDVKVLSGPQFNLDPFVVNLIDDGRGPRYLKVEIKFELEAEGVRDEIETRISQVRDELLILLSSKRQTDIESTDGKRILKDEIFTRVNKILVTGRIKRVFFTEFVIQ
jgi:flagellar FliL protein